MLAIFDDMPEEFKQSAHNLNKIGVSGFAWTIQDTLGIIEWLHTSHPEIVILGGDLYRLLDDGSLESTYDNWYYNRTGDNDNSSSMKRASEYLRSATSFPSSEKNVVDLVLE